MTDEFPQKAEPDPNGWDRFEKAVDAALHTRPQPKPKAKVESKARDKSSKR